MWARGQLDDWREWRAAGVLVSDMPTPLDLSESAGVGLDLAHALDEEGNGVPGESGVMTTSVRLSSFTEAGTGTYTSDRKRKRCDIHWW